MKFCAIIAEYNPLHLGHLKQIEYVKNTLGAEHVLIVMSGNFTQRGEPAVMNKFLRARQAIIAGADAVIELPTVFATANAEKFASGAVKLIAELGFIDSVCFGVESGTAEDFYLIAKKLNGETKEFKKALKEHLDTGVSFAKARVLALKDVSAEKFDEDLLSQPNNILGTEYTRAILKYKPDIEIYPLIRENTHNDLTLKKGITSAKSIREVIKFGNVKRIKKCVPKFVYEDLGNYPHTFDKMIMSSVITSTPEKLSEILDCTEGLENRIKALSKDNHTVDALVEKTTTKRYTSSRIRRILISSLLNIDAKLIEDCLSSTLYAKVLAVKESSKNLILNLSDNSDIPLLTRKTDLNKLGKTATKCYAVDVLANDLYNLAKGEKTNENQMIIV